MLRGRRVVVVVPARDEEELVAQTVAGVPSFVDHVILVDDGSVDRTVERAVRARPDVRVVGHPRSLGVGAAIAAGHVAARRMGADVVAVMAGDGQMCPDDLAALVAPVVDGSADYVKGERFSDPSVGRVMPRGRYLGGVILGKLTALATGLPHITDSQCGFTAMGRRGLAVIDWKGLWPGYGYPNDLLGQCARAGLRVAQVPVRPVYRGEKSGVRARHVAIILGLIGRAAARRAVTPSPSALPDAHTPAPRRRAEPGAHAS